LTHKNLHPDLQVAKTFQRKGFAQSFTPNAIYSKRSGYAGVGGGLAGGFGLAQGGPRIRGELRGDESGATCGGATMRTKRLPAHLKHPASGCSFGL